MVSLYKKAIARVHVILIGILYIIMFSAYLCFALCWVCWVLDIVIINIIISIVKHLFVISMKLGVVLMWSHFKFKLNYMPLMRNRSWGISRNPIYVLPMSHYIFSCSRIDHFHLDYGNIGDLGLDKVALLMRRLRMCSGSHLTGLWMGQSGAASRTGRWSGRVAAGSTTGSWKWVAFED